MCSNATMQEVTLRVLDIVPGTVVDGPGLRTSIYLAGCNHACPGCHNPESWDINGGNQMTVKEIVERVGEEGFDVTLSGGDPLMQIEPVLLLAKAIKNEGYNLWLYTGYTIEEILADESLKRILPYLDAIVEGRFILSHRDTSLRFRGSSNQRIIYNPATYQATQ